MKVLKIVIALIFATAFYFNLQADELGNYNLKWSIFTNCGGVKKSSNYILFEKFGLPIFGKMTSNSYVIDKIKQPDNPINIPKDFTLKQNYPNPFNPQTTIKFELPSSAKIELLVFNVLGQKVKTLVSKEFQAGTHQIVWDSTNEYGGLVAAGNYIFLIRATKENKVIFQETKKMTLLK